MEPKRPDRVRNVFDQLLSQIIEGHAAMTQVIVHAPRNADLATPDQSLEPGSDIHAITEDVAFFENDVADIDANPEAHPPPFRLTFVRLPKRRLDFDCAAHCIKNAPEFGEYAIAGGVGDPTSMTRDELVDNSAAGGQRGHCRFFVAVHQAAVAPDIGGKDCRKASLERRSLHLKAYPSIK
jgi:hypothetical protein